MGETGKEGNKTERLEGSMGRQRCASSNRDNALWILGAFRTSAAAGLQLWTQVNIPLLSLHQSKHFVSRQDLTIWIVKAVGRAERSVALGFFVPVSGESWRWLCFEMPWKRSDLIVFSKKITSNIQLPFQMEANHPTHRAPWRPFLPIFSVFLLTCFNFTRER